MSIEDTIYEILIDAHPMDKRGTAKRIIAAIRAKMLEPDALFEPAIRVQAVTGKKIGFEGAGGCLNIARAVIMALLPRTDGD